MYYKQSQKSAKNNVASVAKGHSGYTKRKSNKVYVNHTDIKNFSANSMQIDPFWLDLLDVNCK